MSARVAWSITDLLGRVTTHSHSPTADRVIPMRTLERVEADIRKAVSAVADWEARCHQIEIAKAKCLAEIKETEDQLADEGRDLRAALRERQTEFVERMKQLGIKAEVLE